MITAIIVVAFFGLLMMALPNVELTRMVNAHFHGGPLSGQTQEVAVEHSGVTIQWLVHEGRVRKAIYRRDESSAGGRCFDWQGWA